jgi:hypothetical protein
MDTRFCRAETADCVPQACRPDSVSNTATTAAASRARPTNDGAGLQFGACRVLIKAASRVVANIPPPKLFIWYLGQTGDALECMNDYSESGTLGTGHAAR